MLRHHIFQTASAVSASTDMNIELVAIGVPLGLKMCLGTQTTFLGFATMVAPIGNRVPSGGLPTIAIVLCEVHLRTAWGAATRVAIAADTTVRSTKIGQIKVVVHIPVWPRQVHVPLDVATACHVERCLGTNTPLTMDSPTA